MTTAPLLPVTSLVLLITATCVGLGVPLHYRLYYLPAILVPATISFRTIQYLGFPPGLSDLWGTITLIGLIHFSSLLYIKKWTLRATQQGTQVSKLIGTWLSRKWWIQVYKVTLSPRSLRTPFKKNIIVLEHSDGNRIRSLAIHGKFSMERVLWLVIKIGTHLLLNVFTTTRLLRPISTHDFAPDKAVLLRRLLHSTTIDRVDPILPREIMMRIWFTFNSIWTPILLLDSIHATLAMFTIYVVRVDTPEDWPDLFGSPLEAFTMSRFWTRFWHRVHLSGYSDYSDLLINMLPHRTTGNAVVRRLLKTFLLFLISGVIHQLTSWQLNPGCSDFVDMQFFCLNAVAVILESAILRLVWSSSPSRDQKSREEGKNNTLGFLQTPMIALIVRFIGHVWVMGFFVWVVPKVYYPRVQCMIHQQMQARRRMA